MSKLSKEIAGQFASYCEWAHYCWQLHRAMFHGKGKAEPQTSPGRALAQISEMTQAYALLQIVKLHDPAGSGKNSNLGLAYIIQEGGWSNTVQSALTTLQGEMDTLLGRHVLASARHKLICHNDVSTIVADKTLGMFPDGDDVKYFAALEKFVGIVMREVGEPPRLFADDGKDEGDALHAAVAALMK